MTYGVRAYTYVERAGDEGRGLLEALAADACVVVTDEWPHFFLPRMVDTAAQRLRVPLDVVDGCGLLPLRATEKADPTAYVFRRRLQKLLPDQLPLAPRARPFQGRRLAKPASISRNILERWPEATPRLLDADGLASLPLDHEVKPTEDQGGAAAGTRRLAHFVKHALAAYADDRNKPEVDATSHLSPWLHFGHVSTHQVFRVLSKAEGWSPDDLGAKADGRRAGWWGMGESAEAFLDQVVTWRELGFQFGWHRGDAHRYESLPPWALQSLAAHASDSREHVYDRDTFEAAATHDPLWNAAQRQLRREGKIHGYLRMLWGKKVLEWSERPEIAWEHLLHLNDRWALDGRDPNSTSGIGWCFGRYDRPWAPERPVFGRIRFMSSKNTARKVRVRAYMERYGAEPETLLPF